MVRDQTRKTIDGNAILEMNVEDFNQQTVNAYHLLLETKRPEHVFLNLSKEEFLVRIGAARRTDEGMYCPTRAGLLMFGEEYQILYEYPLYFLDFREHLDPNVRWTDRIQSQSGDWSGNLFDFFSRVSAKLVLDLKKPFQLENMIRIDETPVHNAVREALVNCLVNADFYEPRGVVIDKYLDKIIMKNPGTVIVGKQQMLRGGESEPRNSFIMKMFNLIGYGERAGSGVPDVFSVWDKAGYEEPEIEEQFGSGQPNRTIITLPLIIKEKPLAVSPKQPEKRPEKQPEQDSKIDIKKTRAERIEDRLILTLELMKKKPEISRTKIAQELKITDAQAKTVINKLKERGWIYREGSATNGRWIITYNN